MEIAVTADLHWGHNPRGDEATLALRDYLRESPPDILLLGGDLGTADHFDECLELFQELPGYKAVIPGNHDLWVASDDPRGNSLQVYEQHLPRLCDHYGYFYLERGPLVIRDSNLAVVGSVNWYDYSWSLDALKEMAPDWEYRLRHKRFTRGAHNDRRFIQWEHDDISFTDAVVERLGRHLAVASEQVEHVIVMTHHPAFRGLNLAREQSEPTWDSLLWEALSGNRRLETVLEQKAAQIPFIFSGHTHRARENNLGPSRGYNIGGDYQFKRLLMLSWPEGTIREHTFYDSSSNS